MARTVASARRSLCLGTNMCLQNKLQGNHVWETTERAKAFLGQHLLFGELVIEDGGTGSPGHPNRFLFLTVRTPMASLVGEFAGPLADGV